MRWLLFAVVLAPACDSLGVAEQFDASVAIIVDASSVPGDLAQPPDIGPPILAARTVDYGRALRSASLALVGALPSLAELNQVTDSATYAAAIDGYLADPRFAGQIRGWFRDSMRQGGTLTMPSPAPAGTNVSLDSAPTFAAQLVVDDRPMTDLFTAGTATCPTLDETSGQFTNASCTPANGQAAVGVLTDPGVMAQSFGAMAFRRAAWLQETFACARFPVETGGAPAPKGNGLYLGPWPFDSVAAAPINFQGSSPLVCANCHATLNHLAPLFAHFDLAGVFQSAIQVPTPVGTDALAQLTDWLPGAEMTAWRFGQPVGDLSALGAALVGDPAVTSCLVERAWNWALSRPDVVDGDAPLPGSLLAPLSAQFAAGGYRLRPLLRAIFTGDDFVRFAGPDAVGPFDAEVESRLHGCRKLPYAVLGNVLKQLGVNLAATGSPPTAGQLYASGAQALGAPVYAVRARNADTLTAAGALRLLDLFVQAAPEAIAAMPTNPRCAVAMFDAQNQCTVDGIRCLRGAPAGPDDLAVCNNAVAQASTPAIGRVIAVATILAAEHQCQ